MSDVTDPDMLDPVTRVSQIIVAALIMGVVIFLAIILLFVPAQAAMIPAGGGAPLPAPADSALPLITYVALAMCLADLALSFVVPKLVVANARKQIAREKAPKDKGGDTAALAQIYQTQLIIGAAMLEGGAFFAAIAFMLERKPIAAGMTLVLLIVLAARFPTRDRIVAWLEQQLGQLQEERLSAL
jgi:hypothetical protein